MCKYFNTFNTNVKNVKFLVCSENNAYLCTVIDKSDV